MCIYICVYINPKPSTLNVYRRSFALTSQSPLGAVAATSDGDLFVAPLARRRFAGLRERSFRGLGFRGLGFRDLGLGI